MGSMHPRVVIAAAAVLAVWAGAFALPAAAQSLDEDFLSVDQAFAVEAEGTFGGVTVPTRLVGGWLYGTDRFDPETAASFSVTDMVPAAPSP